MPKNSHCVSYRWHVKCHAHMIGYAVFVGWLLWLTMKLLKTRNFGDQCSISKLQCHGITLEGSHIYPNPPYFEYVSAALVIPKSCISGLAFKNGCPLMFLNYVVYCCFQTFLYEDIELSAPTPSEQTLLSVLNLLHSPHPLHMYYQSLHSLNRSHTMFWSKIRFFSLLVWLPIG